MVLENTRTLRGALAGATAAAAWAAQQPLDKRVFGVRHDDCELLGTLFTRGRAAYPLGLALHIANGALFGAAYAKLAPSVPGPRPALGPLAGLAEHAATWPLTRLAHLHPAASRLPRLAGDRRALAQATWRHLLFGTVLGELERRLNPPADAFDAPDDRTVASNGHGDVEHLVAVAPA